MHRPPSSQAWLALHEKASTRGEDALSEPEQIWWDTQGWIDTVKEGGLIHFYTGPRADRHDETLFALAQLRAFEILGILETIAGLFGGDVPYEADARTAIINAWAEGSDASNLMRSVDSVLLPLIPELARSLHIYVIQHGLG